MATAAKTVYSHITKEPEVCGGQACIDNTRVRVKNVVWFHKEGYTPEQIVSEYPDLSLDQVHAALAYYYDHHEEVEAELAADAGWDDEHERRRADYASWRQTK